MISCERYFLNNPTLPINQLIIQFTFNISVLPGLNVFMFDMESSFKQGSLIMVSGNMLIAVADNSNISDFVIEKTNTNYKLSKLNFTLNWRLCLKVLIRRNYFIQTFETNYAFTKQGVYTFEIYLNDSNSLEQIFSRLYRSIGRKI